MNEDEESSAGSQSSIHSYKSPFYRANELAYLNSASGNKRRESSSSDYLENHSNQ